MPVGRAAPVSCRWHVVGAATSRSGRLFIVPTNKLGWTPPMPKVAAPAPHGQRVAAPPKRRCGWCRTVDR